MSDLVGNPEDRFSQTSVAELRIVDKEANVYKLTSDNEFLARIFYCWEAGKIFSIQWLDLSLSQQDLQKF